jgi:hypothetical protein
VTELKTKPTGEDVSSFLASLPDDVRADAESLVGIMRTVTRAEPRMWGKGMVGFGDYHYRYASGREGDWFKVGFAPRTTRSTVYLMSGFDGYGDLLARLGKHSTGKSCLYLKRLSDVDVDVLASLISESVRHLDDTETDTGAIPRMEDMPARKGSKSDRS